MDTRPTVTQHLIRNGQAQIQEIIHSTVTYTRSELVNIGRTTKNKLSPELWSLLKRHSLTHKRPIRRAKRKSHRNVDKQPEHVLLSCHPRNHNSATAAAPTINGEADSSASAPGKRFQAADRYATPCAVAKNEAIHVYNSPGWRHAHIKRSNSALTKRKKRQTEHRKRKRKRKKKEAENTSKEAAEFKPIFHIQNNITAIYINCRSLWNKTNRAKVSGMAQLHKPDMLFVGETWLNKSHTSASVTIEGYTVLARKDRSTRQSKGGGTLAYAKEGIEASAVAGPDPGDADVIWTSILTTSGTHLMGAVYRPPATTLVESYIQTALPVITSQNTYLTISILGDFNEHALHGVYDTANTLGLVQKVKEPTHVKGGKLDLIFTDCNDATTKVLKDAIIADHSPVLITIPDVLTITEGPTRTMWQYKRADWKEMRKYLRKHLSYRSLTTLNIDAAVEYMDIVLKRAMELHIPSEQSIIQKSSVPWYDRECYQAMLDTQKGTLSREDYHLMLQTKQAIHKEKTRRKIRGQNISQRQFWKLANELQGSAKDRNSRIPPMKKDKELITNTTKKCEEFAKAFTKKAELPQGGQFIPRTHQYTEIPKMTFTVQNVHKWLCKLDPDKASGPNNISPRVYKKTASALAYPLHTIYERMLKKGHWPKKWKLSSVCPVFKKGDPATFTNYRPIALIDVPSKLFETQIAKRVTIAIIRNGYLPDAQFGFRPKHSCSDLVYAVMHKAMTAVNKREVLHVLQTDIAGAFDRVDRNQLIQRMNEAGIHGKLLKLLSSYLKDRTFNVRINGCLSPETPLNNGVVQGSGLGPVMWNIHFTPIFDATQDDGIGFADDLNIMSKSANQLEEAKLRTLAFCEAARITMEPAKEALTTFFPPRHPQKSPQKTIRMVGILLDEELNMEDHITSIIKKARVAKTRLVRLKPYCNQAQLLSMYKTMIWSTLECGNICYTHAAENTLQKLDRFQDTTLRMLGLEHVNIDTLKTRRTVAHASMLYKQCVLRTGPNYLRDAFPQTFTDPRAHLRRQSTLKHDHQLTITSQRNDLAKFTKYCLPMKTFNELPPELFPNPPNIGVFKSELSAFLRISH